MQVNQMDVVELVDGRSGTVLKIIEEPELRYEVLDNQVPNFGLDEVWDVKPQEIKRVVSAHGA